MGATRRASASTIGSGSDDAEPTGWQWQQPQSRRNSPVLAIDVKQRKIKPDAKGLIDTQCDAPRFDIKDLRQPFTLYIDPNGNPTNQRYQENGKFNEPVATFYLDRNRPLLERLGFKPRPRSIVITNFA